MNNSPEMIRQQMTETKLDLAEKLNSLEQQVSEAVHSAGADVTTAAAAIRNVAQSVDNTLDVRGQIDRHPWLLFGGSIIFGYLAVDVLVGPARKKANQPREPASRPSPFAQRVLHENLAAVEPASKPTSISAPVQFEERAKFRHQLRDAAIGALAAVAQEIAMRAVPPLIDYITAKAESAKIEGTTQAGIQRSETS